MEIANVEKQSHGFHSSEECAHLVSTKLLNGSAKVEMDMMAFGRALKKQCDFLDRLGTGHTHKQRVNLFVVAALMQHGENLRRNLTSGCKVIAS
jgi:hypothetical protein